MDNFQDRGVSIRSGHEKIIDQDPDPVCPESLEPDPDPVNVRLDPKPWF